MVMPEIILASASPRRAALLTQLGLPFRVVPSALNENGPWQEGPGMDPEACASHLALAKAREVAAQFRNGLIIGADTIVTCEGVVYGKPRDGREAQDILLRLAGRTHHVITGLAVIDVETGRTEVACSATAVRMRIFGSTEATAYVATGEPLDKAGAYAIQGCGALLVEGIQGDYSTVVGLPLPTLAKIFQRLGLDIWEAVRLHA